MKCKKNLTILLAAAGTLLLSAADGHCFSSYGNSVNSICGTTVFTGDCTLCHTTGSKADPTAAKTAFLAGGSILTDYFCPAPPPPTCTDNDGDGFAVEGGNCGPVDCNDNNAAVNPGAAENCTDGIDNNCNNLIDAADSSAVGCPPPCTDNDGDGFAVEGGSCGPVDCNDNNPAINPNAVDIPNNGIDENCSGADSVDPTLLDNDGDGYTPAQGDCNDNNAAINPGVVDIPNNGIDENCDGVDAVDSSLIDNDGDGYTPAAGDCDDTNATVFPGAAELCTDGIDNDCNGLVDTQDPNAVDCPVVVTCTDSDGDTYAVEGGECGPVDCNDSDLGVYPGAEEICGDNIDNDCDGAVDEGCQAACPDADGDGYLDAACGGTDCNDSDAAINPAAAEVCGNDIDENCNGASDDVCVTCPDGSQLEVRRAEFGDETLQIAGNGKVGTTISIADGATGEVLADGIEVRDGRWYATVEDLDQAPESVSVTTSDGCTVDQEVEQNRHEYSRSRHERDDERQSRSDYRSRSRYSGGHDD